MRKYITILLLLFFCFGFSSPHHRIIARKNATVASCDLTNILFWWRCESLQLNDECIGAGNPVADCTGANTGTLDYSNNDQLASSNSGAAINADANKTGTNGLDIPTSSDYVYFSSPTSTLDDEGRIGFWIRFVTLNDNAQIFTLYDDSNDFFRVRADGTDELNSLWSDAGDEDEITTVDANLSTGTWYFVEFAWKQSTPYREIFVNGVSKVSSSAAYDAFQGGGPTTMYIGVVGSGNGDYHIDQNLIISTDSTDDLYTVCSGETDYPD